MKILAMLFLIIVQNIFTAVGGAKITIKHISSRPLGLTDVFVPPFYLCHLDESDKKKFHSYKNYKTKEVKELDFDLTDFTPDDFLKRYVKDIFTVKNEHATLIRKEVFKDGKKIGFYCIEKDYLEKKIKSVFIKHIIVFPFNEDNEIDQKIDDIKIILQQLLQEECKGYNTMVGGFVTESSEKDVYESCGFREDRFTDEDPRPEDEFFKSDDEVQMVRLATFD